MVAKNKFKSSVFEAIHSAATGLRKAGAINQVEFKVFDSSCLKKYDIVTEKKLKP